MDDFAKKTGKQEAEKADTLRLVRPTRALPFKNGEG
jgi:hypothetical protein